MHTWRSHLRSVLNRLSRTHATNSLGDIERTLIEVFDAQTVRFVDIHDRPLSPDLRLREAIDRPFRVQIEVDYAPSRSAGPTGNGSGHSGSPRQPSIQRDFAPAAAERAFEPQLLLPPEERVPWFVREFHRLEQTHDFMWAGYIVKEMLPRIGLTPPEARTLLDELQADGVVEVRKVPNPRNPDHPTSAVLLQRDNEQVRKILGDAEE